MISPRHIAAISVATVLSVFATATARAWGTTAHQAIAIIAEHHLTPVARTQVDSLLALESGATLASISTWADETRNGSTAKWHYVNLPRDTCNFDSERDCANEQCVVGAIEREVAVYRSDAPPTKRLVALKYLVHLVADVHQPLHAGFADDKGGNRYQVHAFGRGTNLHAVWDSGMIDATGLSAEALAAAAEASPVGAALDGVVPATWASESCHLVEQPGFYPSHKVNDEYVKQWMPVVHRQLRAAGLRLAVLLNDVR